VATREGYARVVRAGFGVSVPDNGYRQEEGKFVEQEGSQMTEQDKALHGEDAGGLGEDDEGRAKALATEKIGEQDQVKEQTASPAPEEDVGAPPMEGGEVDNP